MPEDLEPDSKYWQGRLEEVRQDSSLMAIGKFVRDLAVVQRHHHLSITAGRALDQYQERFLKEWSIGMGIDIKQAQRKFDARVNALVQRASAQSL